MSKSSYSRSRSRSKDKKSRKSKKHRRSSSKSPYKERKHKKDYKDKEREKYKDVSRSSYRDRSRDRDYDKDIDKENRRDFSKEYKRKYIEYEDEEDNSNKYVANNEPAQWLFIWDVLETDMITQEMADNTFQDLSIQVGTSMPNEVRLVPQYYQIYIQYPSIEIATKILYHQEGKIYLGEKRFDMDFYSQQSKQQQATVIPAHLDTTVDWQCEKCNFQNFSKRTKCHKCQRPKSEVCKALVAPNNAVKQLQQQNLNEQNANTSLMVRGPIMHTVTEEQILDVFSKYSSVKDIRLIKDRQTGNQRDFCFVEFFTVQEAEKVLDQTCSGLRILGQQVSVLLSRNNKKEDNNNSVPGLGMSMNQNNQLQYLSYLQAQEQPTIIQETSEIIQQNLLQNEQQANSHLQKLSINTSKSDKKSRFKSETEQLELEKKKQEIQKQKLEQQRKKEEQLKIQQEIEKKQQQEIEKKKKEQSILKKRELDLKKWEKQQEMLKEQEKYQEKNQETTQNQNSFINQSKEDDKLPLIIICSICKRKFASEEKLKLHDKLSELHKINLKKVENYKKE